MGDIVYYVRGNKKKAYLNITPNYECTNDCVFCDKHMLEGAVQSNLYLEEEPSLDYIVNEIKQKVDGNAVEEFVFCGIGEPLIYLDKLINITIYIKKEYNKPVRVNTNGQAYIIHPYKDVVTMLEKAGVDSVSISLNVTDAREYNLLHKPKYRDVFNDIIEFVKDCNDSAIETTVTFLEFPKHNKKEIYEFTRKLGLRDEQVRFRPFITR
ncbi:radical SAM protein [Candidatus Woesearchaeota archaeon]|nr:radical SAM protein [Candidatus Woesearchaeota archaeon]